jgi:hypothetical protein
MANTDYPGIDYGMGQANIDPQTGIHYGVIQLNSLNEYAIEDFKPDYGEPHCPKCGNDADEIGNVEDDVTDWEHAEYEGEDYVCMNCEYVFDSESAYCDEPIARILDTEEYKASLDQYNDVFILKSPYYTRAQYCSPCAPGAGYLDNPCETGPKTYCFGADWFDGGKAPYPVYRVSDDALVQ